MSYKKINADSENKSERRTVIKVLRIILPIMIAGLSIYAAIRLTKDERIMREQQRLSIINSGVFHEGIVVQGVDVGGMTMDQALRATLKAERELEQNVSFDLLIGGKRYSASAEDFNLSFNTREVLIRAMSVGREGTLKELEELLESIKTNKRNYKISYTADEVSVRSFIASLAESEYIPPKDAKLSSIVDPRELDSAQKNTDDFVKTASSTTSDERISYVREQRGKGIDSFSLYSSITDMLRKNEFTDILVPTIVLEPEITLENIEQSLCLRGKASTSYAKSPYNRSSRVYNIKKAVAMINGVVLEPDEVFSTNTIIGNRTYDTGWKGAPAIVGAKTEDQAGGGVCQVSTTMYNCVLLSDLEVVDRRGHSSKIGYVAGGLDATIDSGHIDFQWRNNTNTRVYVFAWVDTKKKTVNFEIYGEPFPDEYDEIKLSSKKLSTISPTRAMKYVVDYNMEPGETKVSTARKYGSVWASYLSYYKDGEKVKTVEVARTSYKAYAGETIIGPQVAQASAVE